MPYPRNCTKCGEKFQPFGITNKQCLKCREKAVKYPHNKKITPKIDIVHIPYKCMHCGKKFKSKASLVIHKRENHGKTIH